MLNASNFSRNAITSEAIKAILPPTDGNRKARRRAFAVLRQERTTTGHLDKLNEIETKRVLHPTKGWRRVNPKRMVASTIVTMAAQGFLGSSQDMREALAQHG